MFMTQRARFSVIKDFPGHLGAYLDIRMTDDQGQMVRRFSTGTDVQWEST